MNLDGLTLESIDTFKQFGLFTSSDNLSDKAIDYLDNNMTVQDKLRLLMHAAVTQDNTICETDWFFDQLYEDEDPIEIAKMVYNNQETFNPHDEYFMRMDKKLISFSNENEVIENVWSKDVLRNLGQCDNFEPFASDQGIIDDYLFDHIEILRSEEY